MPIYRVPLHFNFPHTINLSIRFTALIGFICIWYYQSGIYAAVIQILQKCLKNELIIKIETLTMSIKTSNLITKLGDKKLRDELDFLWRKERPKVTSEVSEAAKLGDRSENAEYIYGKKRLREIDRRIRFLRKRLDVLQVVSELPSDQSRVYFGAYVEVEDEEGASLSFQIVGADEIGAREKKISINSPMARAIIGRSVGDAFSFHGPVGELSYVVVGLKYEKWKFITLYKIKIAV